MIHAVFFIMFFLKLPTASAAVESRSIVMLPISCSELLQETEPFINFFEAVGRGLVKTDKELSKKIFSILALREKLEELSTARGRRNPIDILIQKTLCFYREQKEPLKEVSYDNSRFVSFIKESISELDKKVQEAIYKYEVERFRREYYELKLEENNKLAQSLRLEAQKIAELKYKTISNRAKKKIFSQ